MIYSTFSFLAMVLTSVVATSVPTIKLCAHDDCPTVSRMGMGTLHLGDRISGISDPQEINAWIQEAVSHGITLFDMADVYPVKGGEAGSSAKLFGQALALTPGLREKLTLVAKMDIIFPSAIDTTREHLLKQVSFFLDSIGTTYLDIVLLHYGNAFMDADEVASLFIDLHADNIVKHFGVSNHNPSKFDLLQRKLDELSNNEIKLVTHEFEASVWNPSYMNYDSSVVDHAYSHDIHPLAWCPLGGDPLGGLNRLFVREGTRQTKILRTLKSVGEEMGITDESVVALTWLISHPVKFIPLLGTTNLDRMRVQVTAFQYEGNMTNSQWWDIGGKGGLCALGDNQCNYDEYMP